MGPLKRQLLTGCALVDINKTDSFPCKEIKHGDTGRILGEEVHKQVKCLGRSLFKKKGVTVLLL